MGKIFEFKELVHHNVKKHKVKPVQFGSVTGGVQKRLEDNLKYRKSSRLSVFDRLRSVELCESAAAAAAPPAPVISKGEHRRLQLEKWKAEKEKQKKEAAANKKKPFWIGVPRAPLKFVPPPRPPQKPAPSTSGRVTRSQAARNAKQTETKENKTNTISFAPKNASFHPPALKNVPKLPIFGAPRAKRDRMSAPIIRFEPILSLIEPKQTRSKAKENTVQTRAARKSIDNKNKVTKQAKPAYSTQSSSSSELESYPKANVVKTKATRKSINNKSKTTKPTEQMQISSSSELESYPKPNVAKTKATRKSINNKSKTTKPTEQMQISSSSELESYPKPNVAKTKATRKSINNKSKTTKPTEQIQSSSSSELENSSSSKPKNTPNRKNRKSPTTPKNSIPKSESSSEERLRSPKSSEDTSMTPKQIEKEMWKISPNVTISRGKDNARREMKKKREEGLLDEDASDMDNVDHFRKQLASEIKRMTEMCETWERISEQTVLPEAIQEHVLGAVGQARLLMSQKLMQFSSLIERCARPEPGTALITPADLHGFWDMVFMQIVNVDVRFKKLEEMQSRGWTEEPVIKPQARVVKPVAKPTVKPVVKPAGGQSRLKEMIAAARRAKKEQAAPATMETENKTFEAGFFSISSPVRSPAPSTPSRKPSLLKTVLSNEAKKSASKQNTPFAMLRASVLGKSVECDGVAPLPATPTPQIPLATPGRSILKNSSTTKKSSKKSAKKSIKIVLFNESYTEMDTSKEDKQTPVQNNAQKEAIENVQKEAIEIFSMEVDQKENTQKQTKLHRQDALDIPTPIGVMTRRMRKSLANKEENTPRKALEEIQKNVVEIVTPKRSSRRRTGQEISA